MEVPHRDILRLIKLGEGAKALYHVLTKEILTLDGTGYRLSFDDEGSGYVSLPSGTKQWCQEVLNFMIVQEDSEMDGSHGQYYVINSKQDKVLPWREAMVKQTPVVVTFKIAGQSQATGFDGWAHDVRSEPYVVIIYSLYQMCLYHG